MATRDFLHLDYTDFSTVIRCKKCGWRAGFDHPSYAYTAGAKHLRAVHKLTNAAGEVQELARRNRLQRG